MNAGRTFAARIKAFTDAKLNPAVILTCLELLEDTLTVYLAEVVASKAEEAEKGRLAMTVMPQIQAVRDGKAIVIAQKERREQPEQPKLHLAHLK